MNKDKDDKKVKNNVSEKDSFFQRWSKKKSGIVEENENFEETSDKKNDDKSLVEKEEEEEKKLSIDELAKKYKVVNPESLNNSLDLREFMKNKIPDRLKQLALRRLWKVVPIYGEVSELVEYGEDFTDAATVVDGLQTAYVVGKGYAEKFLDKSEKLNEEQEEDPDQDLKNDKEVIKNSKNNNQNDIEKESIASENKISTNKNNYKKNYKQSESQKSSIDSQDESLKLNDDIGNGKADQKSKQFRPQKMIFKK